MDAQEYTPYKDVTRPIFHRGPGQIGLYILILDIEPEDPKQYSSQKFMWQDLSDKLLAYLQEKELYEIKIAMEEERLMKGVVLDGFKSAYDCKVLRVARKLQQNYTKELYKLRDDQIKFEASLGEFLNLAKTYLPAGINEFKTMADFEKLVKRAKDRKAANVAISLNRAR